ncbi:cobyric acid synthase [Peribacillus sp. SCS-155]|uniref:cobyric acid synthase n=1 Tax=Peribacillus sedimenti TaxID=3115297 RepID=UPI003905F6C5
MKGIMIQGTSSDAGKSFLATIFCRLLSKEGVKVAPFKSQNMSNNSYVTRDGFEIGRAQGIQAEAANTEASPYMNPILLKPTSQQSSEVILFGRPLATLSGMAYRETFYEKGLDAIQMALGKLRETYQAVVIEGAGSPVEINLKKRELVNMKVAELADVPVLLVSDIERGGVFASIVGTLELMDPLERARVKGLLINKFRGDIRLFEDGVAWLEKRTGLPVLGVIPFMESHMIEAEDSLSLNGRFMSQPGKALDIAIIKLPYISNYTDFEPLLFEDDVSVRWVDSGDSLDNPDCVIIPGTKSTIHDLRQLKQLGLDYAIRNYYHNGGRILGVCGGYQMLCAELVDEHGTDTGLPGSVEDGLSLIPARTMFSREKTTVRTKGEFHNTNDREPIPVQGYEIHLGYSEWKDEPSGKAFLRLEGGNAEGYYSENGRLIGTYIHHLFHNDEWRTFWLNQLRRKKQLPEQQAVSSGDKRSTRFDSVAEEIRPHLQWEKIKTIMEEWSPKT